MSLYNDVLQYASAAERGDLLSLGSALRLLATQVASGEPILVSASFTISPHISDQYNGRTLVFSSALVITLSPGLPIGFGFIAVPPSSGNASIAAGSGVTLNGAGTTVTRTLASNIMFGVAMNAVNSYSVTGS